MPDCKTTSSSSFSLGEIKEGFIAPAMRSPRRKEGGKRKRGEMYFWHGHRPYRGREGRRGNVFGWQRRRGTRLFSALCSLPPLPRNIGGGKIKRENGKSSRRVASPSSSYPLIDTVKKRENFLFPSVEAGWIFLVHGGWKGERTVVWAKMNQ